MIQRSASKLGRPQAALVTTLFFVAAFSAWFLLAAALVSRANHAERERVDAQVAPYQQRLESLVAHHRALLKAWTLFASRHPEDASQPGRSDDVVQALGLVESPIEAFYLIRNDRVVYSYPSAPSTLGYDMRGAPPMARDAHVGARRARGTVVWSQPFLLPSGQRVFSMVRAVELPDGKVWGEAVLLVHWGRFLDAVGLDRPPPDLALALRQTPGVVLIGQPAVFDSSPTISDVTIAPSVLELGAVPLSQGRLGWTTPARRLLAIYQAVGLLPVGVLSALLFLLLERAFRRAAFAREMARHESDAWKAAIRVIHHEFGNSLGPITSLTGSVRQALRTGKMVDKLDSILATVEDRVTQLSDFLESYALFARLPDPKRRPVPLAPLLDSLATLYPFRRAGVPNPVVLVDRGQLEQVLINLLKNATEAGSPPDEIVLTCSVERGGGVGFVLEDRGSGMSDDTLANAIEPFYSTKKRGSGLGLPLCHEIILRHEGTLRITARPGGGTVVRLWLPGEELTSKSGRRATSPPAPT